MPSVSIIIPVFNAGGYIVRCAESLMRQTLGSIEFIFVDDCSTDDSLERLKEVLAGFPERADSVRVLTSPQNMGQAAAFRRGLELASGEYVIKCDADDEILPEMMEAMFGKAVETDSDIVICDVLMIYPNGRLNNFLGKYKDWGYIESLLCNHIPSSLCNKLVRRSLLTGCEYHPKYNMCEDFVYTIQLLADTSKVEYINQPFYRYYRYPESFTWKAWFSKLDAFNQIKGNFDISLEFLRSRGLDRKYRKEITRQCLYIKNNLRKLTTDRKIYRLWRDSYREENLRVLSCPYVSRSEKFAFVATYCHLYLPLKRHFK